MTLKHLIYCLPFLIVNLLQVSSCSSQNNIVSPAPGTFVWTAGPPTFAPAAKGSRFAVDTATFDWFEWSGTAWVRSGERVQAIRGCTAPAYFPQKNQSNLVVNGCLPPEMYWHTGVAWVKVNGLGVAYTGGTGISVTGTLIDNTGDLSNTNELQAISTGTNTLTLSNGGGTVTVDTDPANDLTTSTIFAGDVTGTASNIQIAPNAVGASEIANGAVTGNKIAQIGAAPGQVLGWNGTSWSPVAASSGADGNGIYSGSGSLAANPTEVGLAGKQITFGDPYANPPVPFSPSGGTSTSGSDFIAAYSLEGNVTSQTNNAYSIVMTARSENDPMNPNESFLSFVPFQMEFGCYDETSSASIMGSTSDVRLNYNAPGVNEALIMSPLGITVTQSPTLGTRYSAPTNAFLQAENAQIADIQAIKDVVKPGTGLTKTTGAGSVTLAVNPSAVFGAIAPAGDLSGASYLSPTVSGIQNTPVSSTPIQRGQTYYRGASNLAPGYDNDNQRGVFWSQEFMAPTINDPYFSANQTGTGAGTTPIVSTVPTQLGLAQLSTGTLSTGNARYRTNEVIALGSGTAEMRALDVRFPVLTDGTDTYSATFGFQDGTTTQASITDGCYFVYSTASTQLQAVCEANGILSTPVNTGITVAANTDYDLSVLVNAAGTSATFAINGATVATVSTNIPTGIARATGAGAALYKSFGANPRLATLNILSIFLQYPQ